MLSSRVTDPIELGGKASTLSVVRRAIKAELEAEPLFGEQVFNVWINEDAPAAEGSVDAWEQCLRQVTEADVVLVLYNGNAGWAKERRVRSESATPNSNTDCQRHRRRFA
jgi:hypothetical protein